mgnify:CR=1 FL=1
MDDEHVLELIPGYALGCLDGEEVREVEAHLRACTLCRAELAVYEGVADQIALAVPQAAPPAGLKGRLMARVEGAARVEPAAAPAPAEPRSGRPWQERLGEWFRSLAPVWAPVSLVLIIALIASNILLWQQARGRAAPAGEAFVAVELAGGEGAPHAHGYLVFTPGGAGDALLVAGDLPVLEPGLQYQLWLIEDGERDSGGVFSVAEDGSAVLRVDTARPITAYDAFGVTVEPAGGSPGPTGDRVLAGEL